tara:strand:+ start:1085 stop:1510 length:426 start_codon:yes stop_codon:yes gene_type:complete
MAKLTVKALVDQGEIAAERYDACDNALQQLNEGFGVEYDSAKKNLQNMLVKADASSMDLSVFQGEESLFKFPDYKTNIVVRIDRIPTPHDKLDKLDDQIADLEKKLKLKKAERKHVIEQLVIKGQIDMLTDRVSAIFRRLK